MSTPDSMVTVGGAIASATASLRTGGIESARLDAELLLGHVTGKSRTRLVIDFSEPLDKSSIDLLDELIRQRAAGTPVAYLIGCKEFMGHTFEVGPGVLVPRPETELLVERAAMQIARCWPNERIRVLDLCTGSGAIALSLAMQTDPDHVQITGSDISPRALEYAARNRHSMGLDQRVELVEVDLLAWTTGPWDMLLSNPPYLRPDQIDGNREIAAEPLLALDGGSDGLELIERILGQAVAVMAPRFAMMIEIDPDQADAVRGLAVERFPAADVIIVPDLTGRARFLAIEHQESYS